ncbi:MAG TPA: cupin domain-containing protein [Verrucomicrobiae bacterium]|nr:cupin domain-containing protein [Verrucomicrobiae bacterium]
MVPANAAARFKEDQTPKAQKFSLRTPYMKQGRVTQLVAETPNMWIHTKINAEGGENEIHTHLDEDHSFIVLEGEMSVFDEKGNEMKLKKYEGVLLPKGAYYRYLNTGAGNLVVIRVGSIVRDKPKQGQATRVTPTGEEILGGSVENKSLPPIEDNRFFADEAR